MRKPLLGREAEVAALVAALDAISRGETAPIVQVVGEPGIGKSRLLAELCDMAEARDHLVLTGRAGEFESELPFGVFVDALDDYLLSLDPSRFDNLTAWLPELAGVFAACAGAAGDLAGPIHAERYRTYRALRALLEELARTSPVVLVLDDLHWVDTASAEMVTHLANHLPSGGVLLAVGLRPTQIDPHLATTLAAAAREGRSRRLELPPITFEQARLLLDGHPAGVQDELYRESGGNPFYLEQLARGWTSVGSSTPSGPSPASPLVPDAVRAALTAELASLSPTARELLQGASVVGDPFDSALAGRAAAQEGAELSPALDELAARELIREEATPRTYRFRHPIVRRAVYDTSGPGWRINAHARVASALEESGADPLLRAHHVARSAAPGDEQAIALLVTAGQITATQAPLTAALWYDAAAGFLPQGPEYDDRRLELDVMKAVALGTGGKTADCHAVLEHAVQRLPLDHPARVRLVAFCASIEAFLGRFDSAKARLLRELDRVHEGPSTDRAQLEVELAVGASFFPDADELRLRASTALATCRGIGDGLLTVLAAGLLALAEIALGNVAVAQELLDEGAKAYDALDAAELAERVDATLFLAQSEMCAGRFDDTIRHCEHGIAVSRAAGRGHWLVPLLHAQAYALIATGRLAEAREATAAAVEIARLGGQGPALVTAGFEQCVLATATGDHAQAVRAGEEAVALARSFPPSVLLGMAGDALARALVEMDEYTRAKSELLESGGGPDLPRLPMALRAKAYETLVRADLALGRHDEAARWAERAEAATGGGELSFAVAAAKRARAAVALAAGDAVVAAELALEAADAATAVGAVIDRSLAQVLAGRALASTGQRERAISMLGSGEESLRAAGAEGYRQRAVAELRRLGRRPSPSGTRMHAPAALTPREREIAELVSKGLTNREIASACYLSEKTVETHLAHIFAKLGISSRATVAAALERR